MEPIDGAVAILHDQFDLRDQWQVIRRDLRTGESREFLFA
jgi:hypothetical protein